MDTTSSLTRGQAASLLGVSPEYVRQLALAGLLTYVETPLGRLYDAESVHQLAESRRNARSGRPA